MTVQSYRQLVVWQKAMDLVKQVYEVSQTFPKEEIYGLTSQIRRAAISVPSNIAEGQGRDSTKEFLHHLSIAYGSLMEVETQLLIAESLNYLKSKEIELLYRKNGRNRSSDKRSYAVTKNKNLTTDHRPLTTELWQK